MKKVYLAVIYIITALCIIAGIIIHLGKWSFFGLSFVKLRHNKIVKESLDLEYPGENMDITVNCNIGEVIVKRGDRLSLNYNAPENLETRAEFSGNHLMITQKGKSGPINSNDGIKVELTVPGKVHNLMVHSDLGDIKVDGIEAEAITVTEDLGAVHVKNCTGFSDMTVTNDLGEIEIKDCGDFKDFDVKLEVSLGSINYFGEKITKSYENNSSSGKKLVVENSLGDIIIK